MYRDGADPQYPQYFKQKAQMSNDVHKLWFNYEASISDLSLSLACHIHSTSSGWSDIAKVSSGGFKGGKGGANAPPFWGLVMYFCVHICTSPSNDYTAVACSNNNQAQLHTHASVSY